MGQRVVHARVSTLWSLFDANTENVATNEGRPWWALLERIGAAVIVLGGIVVAAAGALGQLQTPGHSVQASYRNAVIGGLAIAGLGLVILVVGGIGQLAHRRPLISFPRPLPVPALNRESGVEHPAHRQFVSLSPEHLRKQCKRQTEVQVRSELAPLVDKWLRVSGKVDKVTLETDYARRQAIYEVLFKRGYWQMSFNPRMQFGSEWEDRLRELKRGSRVQVVGRIKSFLWVDHPGIFTLVDCELQ